MKILISGASGLVGKELRQSLTSQGHQVFVLHRNTSKLLPFWDIEQKIIKLGPCKSVDAVINLAGESIALGRWTEARKENILHSRIDSTQLLAEFFARVEHKPKVFISASAVGIYGDRDNEELTEVSNTGSGFLAKVGKAWELATQPAAEAGIRVVNARFGIVLSTQGGALAKMLPPFRFGLGGIMGSGEQWMSWISIHELPGIINHLLNCEQLSGPVNITAPQPVTNREFSTTLGKLLCRPVFLPAPRMPLEILFGEMANELLLSSAKVMPGKLLESGYVFQEPNVETALRHILGKS